MNIETMECNYPGCRAKQIVYDMKGVPTHGLWRVLYRTKDASPVYFCTVHRWFECQAAMDRFGSVWDYMEEQE